ncbi:alpha/beta hydrolase fold domain-containing protein [Gordonia sp. zg691]|uniref:Alpha/beta hydrolase fold domain-containing protein n=1 Tax=Gordonia jinghuaiqii TaxID=2758710 RepID=A0A7D7QPY7_9ACTN|nr:alpha/beta hydrolase fold domain-containing protein [Gordonia jinghuaiqii]MBD0862958.1 alpha/beta hydrolase fold domain-containing protein [Gordonia jinghuaiqii]MCR5978915.1 alpha/beta hydrolase fold domain-containing protein [Gordonia jinghuaiqii]QMT01746.1 alpha/beta hydrolase fold domain-containing protein [Gordonia jinghuaiqii]
MSVTSPADEPSPGRTAPPPAADHPFGRLGVDPHGSRRSRAVNAYLARVTWPMMAVAGASPLRVTAEMIQRTRPGLNRTIERLNPPPANTRIQIVREVFRGGQIRGEWVTGRRASQPRPGGRIIYYLHGSGYVVCSPRTHRGLVARLSNQTELSAFSLDYRLGPEHPWPSAGNDAIRGYRWLLSQGYRAEDIVVAGDSAGGHLALDLLAVNHTTGTPQPGSMVLFSPLYDPTFDLAVANQRSGVRDPIINAVSARKILRLYTRTADPDHPRMRVRLTPDMSLPTTLIQYGALEVMGADARATHDEIIGAGGVSVIQSWPDQGHVFQLLPRLSSEARQAVATAARFISVTGSAQPLRAAEL